MSGIVSNTSPLIVLAKADLLALLPKLFTEIAVPHAVRDEIMAGPETDPMRRSLPDCSWLRVVTLDPPLSPLAALQLGRGEAEVIECAQRNTRWAVLLDDRAGRRTARALGMQVFGTLSVVAVASQQGHIESFDTAVERLRSAGLYASDQLLQEVRQGLQRKG